MNKYWILGLSVLLVMMAAPMYFVPMAHALWDSRQLTWREFTDVLTGLAATPVVVVRFVKSYNDD